MAASSSLPETDKVTPNPPTAFPKREGGVVVTGGEAARRAPLPPPGRGVGGLGPAPLALFAILLAGAALRAWILAGPLGEVEADEAVIGLMALHINSGEYPALYWGQPYLGSLEAYLVAVAFSLFGPSNQVLKVVPALAYLAFSLLVYF